MSAGENVHPENDPSLELTADQKRWLQLSDFGFDKQLGIQTESWVERQPELVDFVVSFQQALEARQGVIEGYDFEEALSIAANAMGLSPEQKEEAKFRMGNILRTAYDMEIRLAKPGRREVGKVEGALGKRASRQTEGLDESKGGA